MIFRGKCFNYFPREEIIATVTSVRVEIIERNTSLFPSEEIVEEGNDPINYYGGMEGNDQFSAHNPGKIIQYQKREKIRGSLQSRGTQ